MENLPVLWSTRKIPGSSPPFLLPKEAQVAGYSPLECAMLLPPISTCVFSFLSTPDYLCLRNTSRAMRGFTQSNKRFFRNLVFVKQGGEKWLDLLEGDSDKAFSYGTHDFAIREVIQDILKRRQKQEAENKKLENRYVNFLVECLRGLDGEWRELSCLFWLDRSLVVSRELAQFPEELLKGPPLGISHIYYPRMMGRHLVQVIRNLPIGRNVTTIILDGTGVGTECIQLVITRFSSTLRGLSVKNCGNIDLRLFTDWLLQCLHRHIPVSLKWLRIWGIGGLPDFFRLDDLLDAVPGPTPHPDDRCLGQLIETSTKRKLLANLIPRDLVLSYVRLISCPMFKHGPDRTSWLQDYQNAVDGQYEDYEELFADEPDPFPFWDAPIEPLGDPSPIIALMAVANYMKINIDFSLCAAGHFCWSFLLADSVDRMTYLLSQQATYQVTVGPNTYYFPQPTNGRNDVVHTHSLAEVEARKSEGGQRCHVCGMWEDVPAPFSGNTDEDVICEVGGVRTGPGIGKGRMSIGNLCKDCRRMQTCVECGKFVCHNCLFADRQGPLNPRMVIDPMDLEHLKFSCPAHGGECVECTQSMVLNYFECEECSSTFCLRCEPPSGRKVATDLYGGEIEYTTSSGYSQALKVAYAKKSAFVRSRFSRLQAYRMLGPLDPEDLKGVKTVAEGDLYELCDGCDSATCCECVTKCHPDGMNAIRQTSAMYTTCYHDCRRVFCEKCDSLHSRKCKFCDVHACSDCLWENDLYGVPGLDGIWCRAPNCLNGAGLTKFTSLKGPWEDEWDGVSGKNLELKDPLIVMVNALKASGHLPGDISAESAIEHYRNSQDRVLGALASAAELLSSTSSRNLAETIQAAKAQEDNFEGDISASPLPYPPSAPGTTLLAKPSTDNSNSDDEMGDYEEEYGNEGSANESEKLQVR